MPVHDHVEFLQAASSAPVSEIAHRFAVHPTHPAVTAFEPPRTTVPDARRVIAQAAVANRDIGQ